jgi:hypothetical protein
MHGSQKEFSYNSLCDMWESSQLSFLEIPPRTNVKGKIGLSPIGAFQPWGNMAELPLVFIR